MAHANQDRYGKMVDAKLRANLVTRDNYIFNNNYEGDPKAGKVKIPVRDTEVEVKNYDKANGVDPKAGTTTYLDLDIDQDEAVNELIDWTARPTPWACPWTRNPSMHWRPPVLAKAAWRKAHWPMFPPARLPVPAAMLTRRRWQPDVPCPAKVSPTMASVG